MARLVVQPGSLAAWEIQLKAGTNSFGRGPANDVTLDDPSVSGSHCQIVVDNAKAVIIDLGSTNGTYVNRTRVREAALQAGQTIHLGGLEMMFHPEATTGTGAAPAAPTLPPPRAAGPPRAVRVGPAATVAHAAPPVAVATGRQAPIAAPPVTAAPTSAVGSGPCKYHPRTPGRLFCSHCQLFFCEICVTTRGHQKFCRTCGTECLPVQVQIQRPAGPKSFYARLPGAFVYPFHGSGLLVLIATTFVLALLDFLGSFWLFFILKIIAYGYLFSFMQNLIHATANEEEEMPDLPGVDDVLGGALRLTVTVVVCFGVPILLQVLKIYSGIAGSNMEIPTSAIIATMVLGCLYFPMAFLAVAMKDTALAANPLVVIPAIFKVPLGYLVTTMLVIGIFALRQFGGAAAGFASSTSLHTQDMSTMFLAFGLRAIWSPGERVSAHGQHAHPRPALRHQ